MKRPLSDRRTELENRYASTASVARALGISVTTVKRWVDEGVLPAHRTAGGHRKLLLADVQRLVREGRLPHADLTHLDPRVACPASSSPGDSADSLLAALKAGDSIAVRSILHGAYRSGLKIEEIADAVLSPAFARVGHDWATGAIDVFHEHRGTQLCKAALYELKAGIEAHAERNRPVALGGGPEGDHYTLPSLLAQMALLDAGWDAVNIGPNTPMASFRQAIATHRPRLMWLSVSHLPDAERFLAEYAETYRFAVDRGVAVAVGGQGLTEDARKRMAYTTHGDGLAHLVAFAKTLNPRPQAPRRGRPAKGV